MLRLKLPGITLAREDQTIAKQENPLIGNNKNDIIHIIFLTFDLYSKHLHLQLSINFNYLSEV